MENMILPMVGINGTSMLFNFESLLLQTPSETEYGGVAQLGEHLPCKQGVRGSNPLISTKCPLTQMGS